MRIALIGYGKMGKEIEQIALSRGHQIVSIIDINNIDDIDSDEFKSADVAIEFTSPAVAVDNYKRCFKSGVALVSGTTGWTCQWDEIKTIVEKEGKTFFWASNFSLGVNIFFTLNKYLAKIMDRFPEYNISMTEVHHTQKLDAPSGTAITLAEGILENVNRKDKWVEEVEEAANELAIHSIREGAVPGIHVINYESDADTITIKHDAKNRKGLAMGAVLAAEFTCGKKGLLGMKDMLTF
ncbi:MAG: 4-hydroxy-tetrahydrodipicolinate reductase [Bacteroidales bacterium]|nr:4-hydroxy-tetrahydrodipicolinate reductase [Bacteroidales bacterium]